MSRSTNLHPLAVPIAIYAGFQLGGILGALLAVPIVGVLQVLIRHAATYNAEDPTVGAQVLGKPTLDEPKLDNPTQQGTATTELTTSEPFVADDSGDSN